jgi:hypothetical protein
MESEEVSVSGPKWLFLSMMLGERFQNGMRLHLFSFSIQRRSLYQRYIGGMRGSVQQSGPTDAGGLPDRLCIR